MAPASDSSSPHGGFPTTLWGQLTRAKEGDPEARRVALNALFQIYWAPIYSSIRFGWNRDHDEAKDLTQAFVTDLLVREFWLQVDPSRGRFRNYLKTALKHFMLNSTRDQARQKRGGGKTLVSLDLITELIRPGYADRSPEEILDREWVRTVLAQALEQMREDLKSQGKTAHYDVLRLYYLDPQGSDAPTYAQVAESLGLRESDVRYYLHEAKSKLRTKVADVIQDYAASEADLKDEARFILG